MNRIILMGRLTRDPEVRYAQGENPTAVARYSLAVDRRFKRDGGITADFFNIVAFGSRADFSEKYLRKGMKMLIAGRVQTGYYDNKDGVKTPFFEVVVEEQEFAESRGAAQSGGEQTPRGSDNNDNGGSRVLQGSPRVGVAKDGDVFLYCPDDLGGELPFD
ncbi:MAG: single-stranded DNA-binding protein [Clostridiales bacterium]|nr:single-stranded DNA-binding protein [Clostridiales bacterium]